MRSRQSSQDVSCLLPKPPTRGNRTCSGTGPRTSGSGAAASALEPSFHSPARADVQAPVAPASLSVTWPQTKPTQFLDPCVPSCFKICFKKPCYACVLGFRTRQGIAPLCRWPRATARPPTDRSAALQVPDRGLGQPRRLLLSPGTPASVPCCPQHLSGLVTPRSAAPIPSPASPLWRERLSETPGERASCSRSGCRPAPGPS